MTDMVKLRDVLTPWKDMVQVEDPRSVPLISVKLYGQGAVRREISDGKAPKPFTGNRGRAGQFVFSRIWARRGAMALLPSSLDGVVVTNEFPLFDINQNRLEPKYLLYLVQTRAFLDELERVSAGASGQNRVKEAAFLNIAVQLPPLDEQRRIVDILDRADAIRAKRRHMLADFDELPRSLFERMFGNGDWNRIPLNQIVGNMQGGKNLVADDASAESVNRVLKISAVTSGHFRPEESKPLPDEYVPPTEHFVRDGDLLITRANTAEMVGAAVLVHGSYPHLVLPDKIWRFVWRDAAAQNPVYILWLLRTLEIRRAMSALSSGTSGSMKNISKAKLLAMNIPFPPISLQRDFARRVEAIAAARAKVERALALDDELFASLQSRAFRGEL